MNNESLWKYHSEEKTLTQSSRLPHSIWGWDESPTNETAGVYFQWQTEPGISTDIAAAPDEVKPSLPDVDAVKRVLRHTNT